VRERICGFGRIVVQNQYPSTMNVQTWGHGRLPEGSSERPIDPSTEANLSEPLTDSGGRGRKSAYGNFAA
jgi:hypothetical protein